ncbi:MAG: sulfotransferase [Acetobacteraceae bacterium]
MSDDLHRGAGDSDPGGALLRRAGQLLIDGQVEAADAALRAALQLDPEDIDALHAAGVLALHRGRSTEALALLEQALVLDPDFAEAEQNLGIALQTLGRNGDAIKAHRRAIALDPRRAEAHYLLGGLFRHAGRGTEARESYVHAMAAAPESIAGLLSKAQLAMDAGRPDEAEAPLRDAIRREPTRRDARRLLGVALAELGRFDEAASEYDQVIALDPADAEAYFRLISIRRVTHADAALVERMTTLLSRPDVQASEGRLMTLHFALGKAFDDLGEPASAMRQFDAGNAVRARAWPFDGEGLVRWVDKLIAMFGAEFLAGNAGLASADETPVLIIGMPRSGTTLLERMLSRHPRVGAAGELTFWNTQGRALESDGLDSAAARRMASDYLSLLAEHAPGAARVTDKMPYNFQWVGLIHILFPKARIIHLRRDPIDTCLSIYRTPFDLDQGWMSSRENLVLYYRQYERLMAHWRAMLPSERFTDVDYEDLVDQPEAQARRLVAFCGVEWDAACLRPEDNRRAIRTASVWQARQPVHTDAVGRWRRYEPWLGALASLRPAG